MAGKYTADMDLTYANGVHDGMSYIEAMVTSYVTASGSSNMFREHFTVSGSSRTVTTAAIRLRRSSGSSPLTIRLETAGGSLIEAVNVPASSIPASAPGGDNGGSVWAVVHFSTAHVLAKGSSYNLRASTASGSAYTTIPLREGTDFGMQSYTFTDGDGQVTKNGLELGEHLPVGASRHPVLLEVGDPLTVARVKQTVYAPRVSHSPRELLRTEKQRLALPGTVALP